jgi:hypothetical protein
MTGSGKLGCNQVTHESCFLTLSAHSGPVFQEVRSVDFLLYGMILSFRHLMYFMLQKVYILSKIKFILYALFYAS